MNKFKKFLDKIKDERFGMLNITEESEFYLKYKDQIDEHINNNRCLGKYVGYSIDVKNKLIMIVQEKAISYFNYELNLFNKRKIL